MCRCDIPCPCEFAQPPTDNYCQGIMAWHIRDGYFGPASLRGFNVAGVCSLQGDFWAGGATASLGWFHDERADEDQREALQMIFEGRAGGWPAEWASDLVGESLGVEFTKIDFEIADDLSKWSVRVPGRIEGSAEPLTGPTTPPGKLVQTYNPPGSEVGPGGVATHGVATADKVQAYGFEWDYPGKASKHIPFNWSGP